MHKVIIEVPIPETIGDTRIYTGFNHYDLQNLIIFITGT
jgi:hypothetical protein